MCTLTVVILFSVVLLKYGLNSKGSKSKEDWEPYSLTGIYHCRYYIDLELVYVFPILCAQMSTTMDFRQFSGR